MTPSKNAPGCLGAEETALFCSQAAMVLKSGIPLADGLTALCEDFRDTRSGAQLARLSQAISQTGSLAQALDIAPVLPTYAMRMVRVGEQSGKLDDVLSALGDAYARETRVRRNLRQAVLYPAVLTLLMGAIIAVVVFCVMPVFSQVLRSLGSGLYATAEGVTQVGMVIGIVAMALVGLLILAGLIVVVLLRTKRRASVLDGLCRCVPVLRRVTTALNAERFASAMAMLIGSGYPIEDALPLVEELSGSGATREKVAAVQKAVSEGKAFSDAVGEAKVFDSLHARMLRAGAAAGQVDNVLARLADIYHERFDREVSNAEALIEPLLVTLLAIVAGAILLSVMLPLAGILSSMI